MFESFHDKDYDGIVLKIPSWFVNMNELEPAVQEFYEKLKACNKSMLYSDHRSNLYELEHRAEKKVMVTEAANKKKKERQEKEEHWRKITSGEIYQLEWVDQKAWFTYDTISLNGEWFEHGEIFTNKLNVKAEFEKKFRSIVKDWESLNKMAKENWNNVTLNLDLELAEKDFFFGEGAIYNLFCTSSMTLGISYQRLFVRHGWKMGRKRGWLSQVSKLVKIDGCYAINAGGNKENYPRLDGYKRQGLLLIK